MMIILNTLHLYMRLDCSASLWPSFLWKVFISQLVLYGLPLGLHSELHFRRLETLWEKLPFSLESLIIATIGTIAMEEKVSIQPRKFAQEGNL